MGKREALGKNLRFRIFKRDGFACQYCGRTPPAAVLEVDHVIPRARGGEDYVDNLVTACVDCNRGKGAETLDSVPKAVKEKIVSLEEREDQLAEYKKLLSRKKRRENAAIKSVADIFADCGVGELTRADRQSIRRQFLPKLMQDQIEEAMHIACSKYPYNPNKAWKYFCGVCWTKIRRQEGSEDV